MVVNNYLSVPSKHGSAKDCMVLVESKMFRGDVWVVLKLKWSPRTPPVESCRGRSSFHQPPLLLLSLCGSPISILPFFLVSDAASFSSISVFPFFLAFSLSLISVFPFFFAVVSFLVPAMDAWLIFLLYFGCYEY